MAKLFISYSHKDERLLKKLEAHLSSLKRLGIIEPWHDRRIGPGKHIDHEISRHLEAADIILLLVSSNFIQSKYAYDFEMRRALERDKAGEARVIPVILRPCNWQRLPFGKLLATPTDAKAVSKFHNIDDGLLEVTKAVQKAAEELDPGLSSEFVDPRKDPAAHRSTTVVGREKSGWLVLSFVCFVTTVITALVYLIYRENSPYFVRFFIWYASIIGAIALPAAKYKECVRLLSQSAEAIAMEFEKQRKDVSNKLKSEVLPRVSLCEGMDQVCEMAANIIRDAHKEPHPEYRYVTFYGAASLAIPEAEYEEYGSVGGSGQQSPSQRYLGAIEAATGDKIKIRRYIRLFELNEFGNRGLAVQREYVNWLKSQYTMMSRNPHYQLVNVVRAPQWGANLARIITHRSMMELTGDGLGAVVITDQHLSETVRQYARETMMGGNDVAIHPVIYGQGRNDEPPAEFLHHIRILENEIHPVSTGDEESPD